MTNAEREKAADLVRKLMALSESPEPEEAARAKAEARRVAEAAGLDADDLERETFKVEVRRLHHGGEDMVAVAASVARGCVAMRDDRTFHISGPRRAARDVAALLRDLCERLDADVVVEHLNWGRVCGFKERPFVTGWARSVEMAMLADAMEKFRACRSGQPKCGEDEDAADEDVRWYAAGRERGDRAARELKHRAKMIEEV